MDLPGACLVCGRAARGSAGCDRIVACAGCKVFYRRGLKKKAKYICYAKGNCSTKASPQRQQCKACRFRKCALIGLKIRGKIHTDPSGPTERDCSSATSATDAAVPADSSPAHSDDHPVVPSIHKSGCTYASHGQNNCDLGGQNHFSRQDSEFRPRDMGGCDHADRSCDRSLVMNTRRLMNDPPSFIPIHMLSSLDQSSFENAKLNMAPLLASTFYAVGHAVQIAFGDQIALWTAGRQRMEHREKSVTLPETTLDKMIAAINYHNAGNVTRSQTFVSLLPGISELDPSVKPSLYEGWKWLVFWMIHHADFMTNVESYFTVGPEQYHLSRFWQELILEWPVVLFMYKFCTTLRSIGLNQTEKYILMAIILFEPADSDCDSAENRRLKDVHRHYTDILLGLLKDRCTEASQLASICRKLEHLYSTFRLVSDLHQRHYQHKCPACSVDAKALMIRLQYECTLAVHNNTQ